MPFQQSPFQGSQNTSKADIESVQKTGYSVKQWNAQKHPRQPAGHTGGGRFAPGGGGGGKGSTPGNHNPVGKGEQGQRVKELQARLNSLGFNLKTDGVFGPKTLAAVRAIQRRFGLQVDGLVGPKTTAALRQKSTTRKHLSYARKVQQKKGK